MNPDRPRRALLAPLLATLAAPVIMTVVVADRSIAVPLVIAVLTAVWATAGRLSAPTPPGPPGRARASGGDGSRPGDALDPLTGLSGRQAGLDLLDGVLARCGPTDPASVLYIDLNRFRLVNDTFGQRAGDQVLRVVGERLAAATTPPPSPAGPPSESDGATGPIAVRWSGATFLVVLPGADDAAAATVAASLSAALAEPIGVEGHDVTLTTGIGRVTVTEPDTVDRVIRRAEHRTAELGPRSAADDRPSGPVPTSFSLSASAAGGSDRTNHQLVRDALARNRLEVWFQPIFSVTANERVVPSGAEALVRMRSAAGDLIGPTDFLPGVGRSDLGRKLDERVTSIALDDFSQWRQSGLVDGDFRLSINLCEVSAGDVNFTTFLADQMRRFRIPPDRIVIELAETIGHLDGAVIERIRQLGVALAIDDFGLASSNVDRARDVAVEIVKLDRRWMGPPERPIDERELDILRALVNLCATLDVHVVAEGIETIDQLTMLLDLGVSQIQGYFLSKPLRAEDFTALLTRYRRRVTASTGEGGGSR